MSNYTFGYDDGDDRGGFAIRKSSLRRVDICFYNPLGLAGGCFSLKQLYHERTKHGHRFDTFDPIYVLETYLAITRRGRTYANVAREFPNAIKVIALWWEAMQAGNVNGRLREDTIEAALDEDFDGFGMCWRDPMDSCE